MANGIELLRIMVIEEYGEPCPDFEAQCLGCTAWQAVAKLERRCPNLTDDEAYMAMHWLDRFSAGLDSHPQLDRIGQSKGLPDA